MWIASAREDLVDAREALSRGRYFRAAFFAQQAAEKAFEALFFKVRREHPPPIHSVTDLYHMLKSAGFSLASELEERLYILNKYYTVTRYPDAANGLPSEAVDRLEADRAVKLSEEVVDFAEQYSRAGG